MDWEYLALGEEDAEEAMLVVGVPSTGMVGPICAGFLIDQLKMRMFGTFHHDGLPPMGVVRDGIVSSPVQVWASNEACGPDGQCDRLVVLQSDVPLPPSALAPLARATIAWARDHHAKAVVGLDGFSIENGTDEETVLAAASRNGKDLLKGLKAKAMTGGTLMGFNPALLLRANREAFPALGLFAPVREKIGDARAAVRLLEVVDPLLPNVPLRPEELGKRTKELESIIQERRAQQERATERLSKQVSRSYA